jgi:hypothetical protein
MDGFEEVPATNNIDEAPQHRSSPLHLSSDSRRRVPDTPPSCRSAKPGEGAETRFPGDGDSIEDVRINIYPLLGTPIARETDGARGDVCPSAPKKLRLRFSTKEKASSPLSGDENEEEEEDFDVNDIGTQQLHELHKEVQKEAKDIRAKFDSIDRKRLRVEDKHGTNPPATQRYYQKPEQGPVLLSNSRRHQLEIGSESWPVFHGSGDEIRYSTPSAKFAAAHGYGRSVVRLAKCVICKLQGACTVIVNCGHAIYCMDCASDVRPLNCHACATPISRIVPILNGKRAKTT